jgi:hypothetical protein
MARMKGVEGIKWDMGRRKRGEFLCMTVSKYMDSWDVWFLGRDLDIGWRLETTSTRDFVCLMVKEGMWHLVDSCISNSRCTLFYDS